MGLNSCFYWLVNKVNHNIQRTFNNQLWDNHKLDQSNKTSAFFSKTNKTKLVEVLNIISSLLEFDHNGSKTWSLCHESWEWNLYWCSCKEKEIIHLIVERMSNEITLSRMSIALEVFKIIRYCLSDHDVLIFLALIVKLGILEIRRLVEP